MTNTPTSSELSDDELLRYSRQILLPKFDISGQLALKNSCALIVGLGGLGSPVAMYLAAAGVGQLILVDDDQVDLSNLQRQIAHKTSDIGSLKVESARASVIAINSNIKVTCLSERLTEDSLLTQLDGIDVVVDCSDNFDTRFMINRTCYQTKTPLVSGAAIRMEGQVSVFDARDSNSPCYQCLYPSDGQENLSCSESGVLSPVVGVIGSIQALETIKILSNLGTPVVGKLLIFDAMHGSWRELRLKRDSKCPVCGDC